MKFNSIIMVFKKNFLTILICIFILLLLFFLNSNISSAKSGLVLWATSIVPSVFPFFIAAELLGYTNIVYSISKLVNKFMKPVFNVPGEGAFPFVMGIISGYPIGAKIVSNLKLHGKITNIEAERLIAFTNNSNPLFIIGTVGIGLFNNSNTGILLFITHVLASLSVGFIFRWWKSNYKKRELEKEKKYDSEIYTISITNLGEVLSNSIMNAINTILLIGGFIVLFSVIITVLENSRLLNVFSYIIIPFFKLFSIPLNFVPGFVTGVFELTNGVYKIATIINTPITLNIVICAFLLGFSGFSVLLQVLSIISKAKISIKPYIIGKLLQGIFAAVYTYIIICFIPFLIL